MDSPCIDPGPDIGFQPSSAAANGDLSRKTILIHQTVDRRPGDAEHLHDALDVDEPGGLRLGIHPLITEARTAR